MDRQNIWAAWLAGALIWLSAVGGMAMMDDGAPSYDFIDQSAEDRWMDDATADRGAAIDDGPQSAQSIDDRV